MDNMKMSFALRSCLLLFVFCLTAFLKQATAYAILAHEAIIDASWEKSIKPLLHNKFPTAPDSTLNKARAYAYGGAMIADIGYMPLGSLQFSALMHYVRSGDLVQAMLSDARDVNELAFAIGTLSHYLADEYGHSRATNVTVPLLKPNKKLREKYGDFITYADDHTSHSRLEFSFDVLLVSRGNYTSQAYHDFIGFQVSKPVLERAVLKTYGRRLDNMFRDFNSSVNTLRWGVNNLVPAIIKMTWKTQHDSIMKRQPGMTAEKFRYHPQRGEYFKEFGRNPQNTGPTANLIALLIRIAPKVGPFKTFKYVSPEQEGEQFFIGSFNMITTQLDLDLANAQRNIVLKDIDFDTGRPTAIGEYPMADQTYARWIIKLNEESFKFITPQIREHLLTFFSDPQKISQSKKYPIKQDKLLAAIENLKRLKLQG